MDHSHQPTPKQIIEFYNLQPLPIEGGLFHRNYLSEMVLPGQVLPEIYQGKDHHCGSAIYMLVTSHPDSFSALHKLITDEVYHFYLGDPVEMLLLLPDGSSQVVYLGRDFLSGQHLQYVVPAGFWQGFRVRSGGAYSLIGTTMAPGFEPGDFLAGEREALIASYPDQVELIRSLTRLGEPLIRGT